MLVSELLSRFELYVDDGTELSTQEELDLLNKVYQKVCAEKPWEFLKKSATGTLSTSVAYVALPSDFGYIIENNNYTDFTTTIHNVTSPRVVFVGSNYEPYTIVNWSDRRQYRDMPNVAYIDIANSRLYFAKQPTIADSYEFDYMSVPTTLTTSSTPLIPERFQHILYHGMAIEDDITQRYDKARSYAGENKEYYDSFLRDMCYWNAMLMNN